MTEVDELAKELFVDAMKSSKGLGSATECELIELLELGVSISYTAAETFYKHRDKDKVA